MKNPLVRYVLSAVERYGLPTDSVLAAWRDAEGHPATRQPTSDDFTPLFRAMARLRPDDPDLGLHVGEHLALRALQRAPAARAPYPQRLAMGGGMVETDRRATWECAPGHQV